MEIGNRIRTFRESAGMSQQTLADLLFVSRELVCKWENGSRRPDYPAIERIANVFSVPPDEIADRNDVVFDELEECLPDGLQPDEERLLKILNEFVQGLSGRDRMLFLQRYYLLKPTSEIALLQETKENHIRTSLSRIRKRLRKYLKEKL